jgi:hypothetical protein
LKPAKNTSNGNATVFQNPRLGSWSCGRKTSAASAGDNVNDRMTEMIVEAVIVSANCL